MSNVTQETDKAQQKEARDADLSDLFAALVAAQKDFPAIPRSKTVVVKTRTGGEYTFRYAPLDKIMEAIQPVLGEHGLGITQHITGDDLVTQIFHKSGVSITRAPVPVMHSGSGMQALGSALTYARRYSLQLALNIVAEDDDDGNAAEGNQIVEQQERRGSNAPGSATKEQKETLRALAKEHPEITGFKVEGKSASLGEWVERMADVVSQAKADTVIEGVRKRVEEAE